MNLLNYFEQHIDFTCKLCGAYVENNTDLMGLHLEVRHKMKVQE